MTVTQADLSGKPSGVISSNASCEIFRNRFQAPIWPFSSNSVARQPRQDVLHGDGLRRCIAETGQFPLFIPPIPPSPALRIALAFSQRELASGPVRRA